MCRAGGFSASTKFVRGYSWYIADEMNVEAYVGKLIESKNTNATMCFAVDNLDFLCPGMRGITNHILNMIIGIMSPGCPLCIKDTIVSKDSNVVRDTLGSRRTTIPMTKRTSKRQREQIDLLTHGSHRNFLWKKTNPPNLPKVRTAMPDDRIQMATIADILRINTSMLGPQSCTTKQGFRYMAYKYHKTKMCTGNPLTCPHSTQQYFNLVPLMENPTSKEATEGALLRLESTLESIKKIAQGKVVQKSVMLTVDAAEYQQFAKIVWPNRHLHSIFFVALGGFHISKAYMAAVTKIYNGTGLSQVLADANVFSCKETAANALKGKAYYDGVYGHTVMAQALNSVLLSEFEQEQSDATFRTSVQDDIQRYLNSDGQCSCCARSRDTICPDGYTNLHGYVSALKQYVSNRNTSDPMFKLWTQYIDLISIWQQFNHIIRDPRPGDLPIYIRVLRQMHVVFCAADSFMYERFLATYIVQLEGVETSHPDVYRTFPTGFGFSATKSNRPGSGVPHDMMMEWFNCDMKDNKTGILNHVGNADVLEARTRSAPTLSALSAKLLQAYEPNKYNTSARRVTSVEEAVCVSDIRMLASEWDNIHNLTAYIESSANPFKASGSVKLHHLTTGRGTSEQQSIGMLTLLDRAKERSEMVFQRLCEHGSFETDCGMTKIMEREGDKCNIYSRLTKLLPSTKSMAVRRVLRTRKDLVDYAEILKSVLAESTSSSLSLAERLESPLADIPASFFNPDGTMHLGRKSQYGTEMLGGDDKACTFHKIFLDHTKNGQPSLILIVDVMQFVRGCTFTYSSTTTPRDIARQAIEKMIKYCQWIAKESETVTIVLVADSYVRDQATTKDSAQGTSRGHAENNIAEGYHGQHKVTGKKKFESYMKSSHNKHYWTQELLHALEMLMNDADSEVSAEIRGMFSCLTLTQQRRHALLKNIFLVTGKKGYKVSQDFASVPRFPALDLDVHEADHQLIFCARQFGKSNPTELIGILVKDTDVLAAAVTMCSDETFKANVCVVDGVMDIAGTTYPKCHNISERVATMATLPQNINGWSKHVAGREAASAAIAMHVITGCDTVSYMFGVSKKNAWACLGKIYSSSPNPVQQRLRDKAKLILSDIGTSMFTEQHDQQYRVRDTYKSAIEALFILLYAHRFSAKNVETLTMLRVFAIQQQSKKFKIMHLPEAFSGVEQHVLRAHHAMYPWRAALESTGDETEGELPPVGYGWKTDEDGNFIPVHLTPGTLSYMASMQAAASSQIGGDFNRQYIPKNTWSRKRIRDWMEYNGFDSFKEDTTDEQGKIKAKDYVVSHMVQLLSTVPEVDMDDLPNISWKRFQIQQWVDQNSFEIALEQKSMEDIINEVNAAVDEAGQQQQQLDITTDEEEVEEVDDAESDEDDDGDVENGDDGDDVDDNE